MRDLWSWMGTALAMAGILRGILPAEYRDFVGGWLHKWIAFLSPYAYFVIPEFEGSNMNQLYESARSYLSTKTATGAMVSSLSQPKNAKTITFSLANDQRVLDTFEDVKVEWLHKILERKSQTINSDPNSDEKRSFRLKVHRSGKDRILARYFAHIAARAKEIHRESRDLLLYTNNRSKGRNKAWEEVPFLHPASFDSLALDPTLKAKIVDDLDEFVEGEEFYRRVGKAWKRGYLLFGPPGTGKSSMIAAIANKLRYDIYDLELTEVESNADLRRLLLQTSNKSIIVIEDIDCSIDLSGQRRPVKRRESSDVLPQVAVSNSTKDDPTRVTLSGLLNFTDGLWSSCGSERIFIFTTNFVSKLDPALLRPGRMDMHISLSYCTFLAFRVLARNFLQIKDHRLFPEVERVMSGCLITPAEVAEILTQHKRNDDLALDTLIEAMRTRNTESLLKEEPENDVFQIRKMEHSTKEESEVDHRAGESRRSSEPDFQDGEDQKLALKMGLYSPRATDAIFNSPKHNFFKTGSPRNDDHEHDFQDDEDEKRMGQKLGVYNTRPADEILRKRRVEGGGRGRGRGMS